MYSENGGATLLVSWARLVRSTIVVLLADTGERYLTSALAKEA
jgi:cysteine synthase